MKEKNISQYISCEHLQHSLVILSEGVQHCCANCFRNDSFEELPSLSIDDLIDNCDEFLKLFIEQKKQIIEDINSRKKNFCTNCMYLKMSEWEKVEKIKLLNFSLNYTCNLMCSYCYQRKNGFQIDKKNKIKIIIEKLLNSRYVVKRPKIIFSCGEVGIQSNIDETLDLLKTQDVSFLSNATVYNKKIHDIIKRPSSNIVISLDCGTARTYKDIKGVDYFDKVCENIAKYASEGGNIMLKYILLQKNLKKDDLNGFLNICTKNKIKNIRVVNDFNEQELSLEAKSAYAFLAHRAYINHLVCHNNDTLFI